MSPSAGRLRYLEARPSGGGRPDASRTLVLLHAFPLNARMWEAQFAIAERGWHVVAPQFRGFDGGTGEPSAASVDEYAGDVVDLLDALHIEDAVIGGLSMGGYVAFAVLRNAPRYVQGLILADTKSDADTPDGVAGRQRMLQLVADHGASAIADEMLPKLLGETTRRQRPEVAARVRDLVFASSTEAIAGAVRALMTRPDSTPLLATIHVPTLVIVGSEDTVTPPAAADALHAGIAGSALVVIPEAGHLSNLEQPAAFNAALARFLDHRV